MVLFIMLHMAVLAFRSLDQILVGYSEDICLQTLTSFSITWIKITRACGWQKSFRAGQILCAQTNFQHDFRQVSILEFPSAFDSEAFS